MTENKQAYTGFAGTGDVNSEWNRLSFAIRSVLAGMATTTLVLVKAVREVEGGYVVDVQPMVAQVDGAGNAVPHGIVHNMPVWRLQGGNAGVIVVPTAGDIGIAVFASTDISGVKRAKEPTTPGSARRFDWSDGMFLGGVLNAAPTQFVRIDADGLTITSATAVTINAPDGVTINGDMAVSGDITTGPGSMFNGKSFDDHTHGGVQTGSGTSGPPS